MGIPVSLHPFVQAVPDSAGLGAIELPASWAEAGTLALKIALILVLAIVAYRISVFLARRLERAVDDGAAQVLTPREQRGRTIAQMARYVAAVAIAVVALLTILSLFIPIGPLLAGTTILGLAFSFGAQTLVRDLISGLFILIEGQYSIGDVIRINQATSGEVERMTLRVVVLRDIDGTVHIIPNGEIKQVANLTKEWSRAVLDIGVGYGEEPDRVIAELERIASELWEDAEWRPLLLEEPTVPGIERLDASAVVVRFMAKTVPLKQWEVAREVRRRVKTRFDELGIEIPYPHVTFYWGRGQAPPFPGADGSAGRGGREEVSAPGREEAAGQGAQR